MLWSRVYSSCFYHHAGLLGYGLCWMGGREKEQTEDNDHGNNCSILLYLSAAGAHASAVASIKRALEEAQNRSSMAFSDGEEERISVTCTPQKRLRVIISYLWLVPRVRLSKGETHYDRSKSLYQGLLIAK